MDFSSYRQPNHHEINSILDILLDSFVNNLCKIEDNFKYKNKANQLVVIHHLSDTYLKNNLFLGCTQFFGNQRGRTYMRYPFPVQNLELLATYGKINPPSEFVWRNDELVGLSTGTVFGWEIPNLFIQQVENDIKYFYVAKYLLQGKILEPLKVLQKYLKAQPSIIKPENLDYKVQKLVQTLKIHKIYQLKSMVEWWKKDKKFLKE